MGRPVKKGLVFLKLDLNFFHDVKIIELINEHGAAGVCAYLYILTLVFENGYYLEMDEGRLAATLVRVVGAKSIKNRGKALEILSFLSEISLFHPALMAKGVITSEGVQRRYDCVTSRNKADKSKYWLLKDEAVYGEETGVSAKESTQEGREKKEEEKKEEGREEMEKQGAPTLSQVEEFCKGTAVQADRFFNYYTARGWLTGSGQRVADWQALVRLWDKSEREKQEDMMRGQGKSTFDIGELEKLNVFDIYGVVL